MHVHVDWGPWRTRVCDRCRQEWPLANFLHRDPDHKTGERTCTFPAYECPDPDHYDGVCICCRNTAKHRRPFYARAYYKVRKSVRRHIRQDGFASIRGWEVATGLTVHKLTEDLLRIIELGRCPHCGETPDGLGDMTLDRRDPTKPLTRDNYQWLCLTCNKEKARTPEYIWEIRFRCWQIYTQQIEPHMPVQERLPV